MATRSLIARATDAGYESVYCHWDGYPQHNGVILLTHYRTAEAVTELLSFGDISILGPKIGVAHDFEQAGHSPFTTFYGRDRGDTGEHTRPAHHSFLCGVLKRAQSHGCEFIYLFEDNDWVYCERLDQ
ncbi:MAG: hypothetical protein ABJZ55_11015 [Fuerstiella sp.]